MTVAHADTIRQPPLLHRTDPCSLQNAPAKASLASPLLSTPSLPAHLISSPSSYPHPPRWQMQAMQACRPRNRAARVSGGWGPKRWTLSCSICHHQRPPRPPDGRRGQRCGPGIRGPQRALRHLASWSGAAARLCMLCARRRRPCRPSGRRGRSGGMADTGHSKCSARKGVGVRVPPSAPQPQTHPAPTGRGALPSAGLVR